MQRVSVYDLRISLTCSDCNSSVVETLPLAESSILPNVCGHFFPIISLLVSQTVLAGNTSCSTVYSVIHSTDKFI